MPFRNTKTYKSKDLFEKNISYQKLILMDTTSGWDLPEYNQFKGQA